MARDSTLARENQITVPFSSLSMDSGGGGEGEIPGASASFEIGQKIIELQRKQELQKQKLWHDFQERKQELEMQHQLELEQRIKELRDKQIAEEQQNREKQRERESSLRRLVAAPVPAKEKTDGSANASSEVKQKLQNFLMQKKQLANGLSHGNSYRNWGVIKSSSGESIPNSSATSAHPYKMPQPQHVLVKYDSDYPLRKTASEPNLLKIRLKQSVIERKARIGSFATKRHERLLAAQRRHLMHMSQIPSSSMDSSGPNSPPSLASITSPNGTIAEENEAQMYETTSPDGRANFNDPALFSSPSMPNISLGRPHGVQISPMALLAASLQHHNSPLLHHPYPLDLTPGSSPQQQQLKPPPPPLISRLPPPPLVAPPPIPTMTIYGNPITDSQVAHARLYKQGHRPLGRTQSAPLPLGHPMLTGQMPFAPYDNADQLVFKNRVRQLAFTRKGSEDTLKEEELTEAVDLSMVTEEEIHPLSRTVSSPLVARMKLLSEEDKSQPTTGLAFDSLMLKHGCVCGNNASHPEHSGRLQSIWARLAETGLASRCERLRTRKATLEELQTVHSESHAVLFGSSQMKQKLEAGRDVFLRLGCGGVGVDLDTTWNEHHTASAARVAVGCVVDLAFGTMKGVVRNGFAVVRPPGHHAEPNAAMGFCFFNSVAIAAKLLRQKLPEVRKVLILDWDVHHGNGTQQVFYDDPDVLYLSIHRHDDGNFFPGTGGPSECGTGPGLGFNVNIAWSGGLNPPLGDAEYLAAFRTVVLPIVKEFAPDIILVSSGFDAAAGHPAPLGGYLVSPACFGKLTQQLMKLANGKVVLALEGGYDLPAICDSAQECVKALLGDEVSDISKVELSRAPCLTAVETLQRTVAIQSTYWPCLKASAHTVGMSVLEARASEKDESETVSAMAGLSMKHLDRAKLLSGEPMDESEK